MNNSKIELIAVNRIKDAILRSDILEPYIDDNDKTPSWDGNIFVYKSSDINKKNLKGKIPLQIKGTKVHNFSNGIVSFPFETSDLRNYLNDGGVLFFVVEIIDVENTKIFCKSLLPIDIKELLSESRSTQKTISAALKVIDISNIKRLESICLEFLFHRELQYSTVNHSKNIENFTTINFTVFPGGAEPNKYMLEHEIYIYGKENIDSIPIPIDKVAIETISHQIQKEISINSKVYFDTYSVVESKKDTFIVIGKSIMFNINTGKIDFKSTGNLKERLRDIQFLEDLFNSKLFFIGDIKIESLQIQKNEVEQIHEYLKYLNENINLMKYFNIKEDLDIDILNEEDYDNLNFLIDIVLYNRKIKSKTIETGMSHIKIGNIDIVAFIIVGEDRIINVFNYFSSTYKMYECIIHSNEEEKETKGSFYSILKANDIIKASNLDVCIIEESVKSIPLNDEYVVYVILLILELIKAYDIDKNFMNCLSTALSLCEWIEEFDGSNAINKINRLQIIKRLRSLEKEEKQELIDIRARILDDFSILSGISILLENKSDFEYYFEKLSDIERKTFIEYPIYKLTT